jgi:hypothetical protein
MTLRAAAALWFPVVLFLAAPALAEVDGGAQTALLAPVPTVVLSPLDAEARFLAGLPGLEDGPFARLEQTTEWKTHASDLNGAWEKLEAKRLTPMRSWAASELWPRIDPKLPLVYFFGGPDAISVDVLYPEAPVLVLCGLERPGELIADLSVLKPAELENALVSERKTIRSTVDMSYFITSRMGGDMIKSPLKGVLPVLMLFLARNGEHAMEVAAVSIDKDGVPVVLPKVPEDGAAGWRIRFKRSENAPLRELYYLRLDLSNPVAEKTPGFFTFLTNLGPANSFLKAASFIMHDRHFSKSRGHLLQHCDSVLEDDSGIPFKFLSTADWQLTYFGTYTPPRGVFTPNLQPDMQKAWKLAVSQPLPFATGYKHSGTSSHLLLARKVPEGAREHPDAGH